MPANQSKAQTAKKLADAGIVVPTRAMANDELQAHLGRRPVTFEHRNTKRNRDRSAQRRNALRDQY